MSTEPTSTLTFRDLIIEVSRKIGVAYYGEDGLGVAQVPVDAHDLDECKRHVNNGIRRFLHDAPPGGWRFARPVASVTLWGDIGVNTSNLITSAGYDPGENVTTLTAGSDSFYESMEGHPIVLTGVDTFTIRSYVNATTIKVTGDATGAGTSGVTWSMTTNGNFTLPATFAGQYSGDITYAADSNEGVDIEWIDEGTIRKYRENVTNETGDPWWAAIRPMNSTFDGRRRWELLAYPLPDEVHIVQFPYDLHFDKLVDLDEYPPVPYVHDETIKAACLAVMEMDVEQMETGQHTAYYQSQCLLNSYRIDARSGPKRLGYFGNPGSQQRGGIHHFRQNVYDRPTVTFNP